jgi:glycine cleavage system H protein
MNMKYSVEHEWVNVEGDVATVGITDYAQKALGDIVFVETPSVGSEINQGDEVGVVESVKAASDILAPVSGDVVKINEDLETEANTVNNDPTGDGWMFKVKLSDPAELDGLMNEEEYNAYCGSLDG